MKPASRSQEYIHYYVLTAGLPKKKKEEERENVCFMYTYNDVTKHKSAVVVNSYHCIQTLDATSDSCTLAR